MWFWEEQIFIWYKKKKFYNIFFKSIQCSFFSFSFLFSMKKTNLHMHVVVVDDWRSQRFICVFVKPPEIIPHWNEIYFWLSQKKNQSYIVDLKMSTDISLCCGIFSFFFGIRGNRETLLMCLSVTCILTASRPLNATKKRNMIRVITKARWITSDHIKFASVP